jgi:hypothetical protein
MTIPKKYKNIVSMFFKDYEMTGYIIILKENYVFWDDTRLEYVESQEKINYLLSTIKEIK